jgi:hypothetical protein
MVKNFMDNQLGAHQRALIAAFLLDLVLERIGNIIVVIEKSKLNTVDDLAGAC